MSIRIQATVEKSINYAAAHMKLQTLVGDIVLSGIEKPGTLVCRITSVPECIYEYKKECAVTGTEYTISAPALNINDGFYRKELIEAQSGEIRIEVYDPDAPETVLGFLHTEVRFQPYLHWDGGKYPSTMACFLQPNDPLVNQVLKKAGEYAEKAGMSMYGYQGGSVDTVKAQAGFLYQALQEMDIHYISAPASFEDYGQKLRIPHQVLHEASKQGTCLDLAVLYATCLEAASLNAVIVLIPGHAFSGVWLREQSFSQPLIYPSKTDPAIWKEAMNNILPVECTAFTDGDACGFDTSVSMASRKLAECRYLIDVAASRSQGLVPVYTFTDQPICAGPEQESFLYQEFTKDQKSRIDVLREQAMDITGKSRLLNGGQDALALEFTIQTEAFMHNGLPEEDLMELLGKEGKRRKTRGNVLRELYNKTRQEVRETGKTSLYLAINELKWRPEGSDKSYRAVLYLCPAEIYRNGRGDFLLRIQPEGMIFNPALKVLLAQGYKLDSSRLLDQPGDHYGEQIRFLNYLIENQKGWAIRENVACLAIYSIPNEAVWKGLHEDQVLNHEIVKGILEGRMNWDDHPAGAASQEDGIYVYEADSSQGEIIESAFRRKAQVAIGPAGNGKTQTVVNIMLEAVRRGEKVLFVSEKAPAIEVVYEKLNEALDGLFNLRIVHGTDRTRDVVAQLRKTMDYLENPGNPANTAYAGPGIDAESARKRYAGNTAYLKHYYDLMRSRDNASGKSLEELIEMYQAYADCPVNFQIDEACAAIPWSEAEEQISTFARVMESCDRSKGEYTAYIRYDNIQGKEEQITQELVCEALELYRRLWDAAEALRAELKVSECSSDKKQLQLMIMAAECLEQCPVYRRSMEEIFREPDQEPDPYPQSIVREFNRLGRLGNGFAREQKKKLIFKMLLKLYTPGQAEALLDSFDTDPEAVIDRLNHAEAMRDENGNLFLGSGRANAAEFSAFLKRCEERLAEKEDLCAAVKGCMESIVEGRGWEIQKEARDIVDTYRAYAKAQAAASEKVIRNERDFARDYPDLPRKVLFEEWLENKNNDSNRSRSVYDRTAARMEKQGYGGMIRQIEEMRKNAAVSGREVVDGFCKAWSLYQINRVQEEFLREDDFNYVIFQDKIQNLIKNEEIIRKSLKTEIFQAHMKRMPNIREGVSNNLEFGTLQKLIRSKNAVIRTFFEQAPHMLPEIWPCMIMDPSAVAEYIPLENFPKFDLVLIDEGSQMPTYNALIPISKAKRCMIFGDEKQLQPADEFKKRVEEDLDVTVGRESILTAAYITSMPRKLLRFHYRSENESLVAFSNKNYYNGNIITFPACDTRIKGVSYELVKDGIYDREGTKGNEKEALAVIRRIKEIYESLPGETEETVGVITLNIHQRDLIQSMLLQEVKGNSELGMKVDEAVSVLNLESCQGKEWDHVIISPGFGYDKDGKFSMGFGALNREYGANRLNVMLTRARKRIWVITSIEPYMLGSAKEQGTRNFRDFLQYAKGDMVLDTRVSSGGKREPGLVDAVARALEKEGYVVHTNIGSSDFKVDLGIVSKDDPERYALGILVDHFTDTGSSIHDREVTYPRSLASKGWRVYRLQALNWCTDPRRELRQILNEMEG